MKQEQLLERLTDVAPKLERILTHNLIEVRPRYSATDIRSETVWVAMRDGVRLATDLYLPPVLPAPAVAMRTPYGREADEFVGFFVAIARRGYVVISQDCRGTGQSEPDSWDYYVYESEDGLDLVDWVAQQSWFNGFLSSFGGSYIGQTQWCMAMHPRMSTIVPQVSGLGVASNTARTYMFLSAYAHVIGKGDSKVSVHFTQMERTFEKETLSGGCFDEPLHRPFSEKLLSQFPDLMGQKPSEAKRWLWEHYCALSSERRADFIKRALGIKQITSLDVESLSAVFGHSVPHDALTVPCTDRCKLCRSLQAPPLLVTGWYDWGLNDALATWGLIRRDASESVRGRSRLIIRPGAHAAPGYREGAGNHPELLNGFRTNIGLLLSWNGAVQEDTLDDWPTVIYYLMGANEWRVASDWPVPQAKVTALYLGAEGKLSEKMPQSESSPDQYTYDPNEPTPTVGGSIVSYLYPVGGVDISEAQRRSDVRVYTTEPLAEDLDVIGPLRAVLYASSSALDTDFVARLSDVFPDGRAIQIQSGILRARYRNPESEPELLEPGQVYCFEIDMWATANRFKTGHRLRLDISSADFPRYDRNSNRGGAGGAPIPARQSIYHDPAHPSHLLISILT